MFRLPLSWARLLYQVRLNVEQRTSDVTLFRKREEASVAVSDTSSRK